MRQPKEIPYFEMEGQLDFETDFPEVFPEASEAPVVTQPAVIQTTMTLEEMMGEEPGEQQDEEPEVVATSQQTESQDSATIRRFIEAWVEHCPQDFKSAMRAMREGSTQGKKGKQIQEKLAPYGCHYIGDSDYSLDFGSYAVGMDWRVSREKIHLTYDRLAYELLCMYDLWSHEFDEEEPAANYVESAAEKQQTEIEAVPEEQTAPEAPLTDTEIVRIALQEAQELLDNCLMIPGLLPDDENIRKQKFIVEALEGKLVSMEGTAVATVEVEQPELPVLRNNDQRAAFIDNYESWPLWIETQETGERYYRYDLPDGTSFVIKTYHYMQPDYVSGIGVRYTEGYGANEQYILEPGKFFRNCQSNRSSMIEKLKELQKGKNDGKIN